jgi:adenylate cyclase class IV
MERVRIHLDDVDQLGAFIELEAVASPNSDWTREHGLIQKLGAEFSIADSQLMSAGYADSLLA